MYRKSLAKKCVWSFQPYTPSLDATPPVPLLESVRKRWWQALLRNEQHQDSLGLLGETWVMASPPNVKLLSVISTWAQGWNHAMWMSWGIFCFVKTESRWMSFSHPHLAAYCSTWKESTRRLCGEGLWLQSSISRSPKVMVGERRLLSEAGLHDKRASH